MRALCARHQAGRHLPALPAEPTHPPTHPSPCLHAPALRPSPQHTLDTPPHPLKLPTPCPQSLVAFYLGRGDKRRAADVFVRVSQLALAASAVVLTALLLGRGSLPAVFTKDPAVILQVTQVCVGG